MQLPLIQNLVDYASKYGLKAFPPRFKNEDLEQEIKAVLRKQSLEQTRLALGMGLIAIIAFVILGTFFLPEEDVRTISMIRIIADCGFVGLAYFLTFTDFGKRHIHKLLSTAVIWVSFSINANHFVSSEPELIPQYYPALLLLLFFSYVFIRSNWISAVAAGLIIQVAYHFISPHFTNYSLSTLIASNVYLFIANIVGAVGNYIIEFTARREFWNQKQLEQQQTDLTELNQSLDALVNLRTNELRNSTAFMNNLNTGVGTDLNAPIQSARGYLELLIERNHNYFDSTSWEMIGQIKKQSDKMMSMQAALIEYSRLQENEARHTMLDANMIVQTAIHGLTGDIQNTGAEITIYPLPAVIGDEIQLVMLFRKLLANAIKFNDANPPNIQVDAQLDSDQQCWQFSIRDNGIGIIQKDQAHLFEFFTRLNPEEDRGGTGMGLAICKRIIELHDGKIWVDSEPGKGSTFYFTLKGDTDKE